MAGVNERSRVSETVVAVLTNPIPESTVVGWAVWYSDGSFYRSDQHRWRELPSVGVQVMKKFYYLRYGDEEEQKFVRQWLIGHDAYVPDHRQVNKDNAHDMVKFGDYIPDKEHAEIVNKAKEFKEDITEMI